MLNVVDPLWQRQFWMLSVFNSSVLLIIGLPTTSSGSVVNVVWMNISIYIYICIMYVHFLLLTLDIYTTNSMKIR